MTNPSITQVNQTNCGSRLQCGLCLITNQPCPFIAQTFEPYWKYGVTCTNTTGTTVTTDTTTGTTDTTTTKGGEDILAEAL